MARIRSDVCGRRVRARSGLRVWTGNDWRRAQGWAMCALTVSNSVILVRAVQNKNPSPTRNVYRNSGLAVTIDRVTVDRAVWTRNP